jgi:hypothetical protein
VASLKSKEHNWNALFLGVNAVAEIMADKYKSNKSDILDVQSKGGLALRMALGETQVVAETKEFLLNHGVKLDAFGQVSWFEENIYGKMVRWLSMSMGKCPRFWHVTHYITE